MSEQAEPTANALKPVTILVGAILGMGIIASPAPDCMPPEAWKVLGVALWMAFWWLTEALPVPVTALMPLIALPALGLFTFKQAAAPTPIR